MQARNSAPSRSEGGTVFVLALLFGVILLLLGTALLGMSGSESTNAYRDVWGEGAFWAAEGGVHTGIDRLSANATTSALPIAVTPIGGDYNFRSGRRGDGSAQPLQFVGTSSQPGYSISSGTGYNPSGYVFFDYLVIATGTGPRSIQREIEARAAFGPVPM